MAQPNYVDALVTNKKPIAETEQPAPRDIRLEAEDFPLDDEALEAVVGGLNYFYSNPL